MAIGVLIKRTAKPGTDAKVLFPQIVEIRSLAVRQPGYISGETFFNIEHPEECIVISKWTTEEHWQRWEKDPRRIQLNKDMEKHLAVKPEYDIYGIGLW